jgi:hypothetical protein
MTFSANNLARCLLLVLMAGTFGCTHVQLRPPGTSNVADTELAIFKWSLIDRIASASGEPFYECKEKCRYFENGLCEGYSKPCFFLGKEVGGAPLDFHLPPGLYDIGANCFGRPLQTPLTLRVNLLPGHIYKLDYESDFWAADWRVNVWIQDLTTGQRASDVGVQIYPRAGTSETDAFFDWNRRMRESQQQ